ncbi:MAG: hypothetical protein BGO98_33780 [Myxococcales bacterium 68-20]|nr:hypothetical protein [Myxococcales bacterium]OJY25601.1 MAG: hypothetical protein BGO98_33780 [Myxococcales bacterium 68-20]
MAGTLTAQGLIQLPSLTAEETVTLATKLITAAQSASTLPGNAPTALDDVKASLQTLSAELAKRGQRVEDKAAAREADTQLDRVWSAIDRFLSAWAAIDGTELAEQATALRQRLFPDGLAFLTKNFNAEWAASEQRLGVIDAENHVATFERLGGGAFVASLRRAHKAYGQALGVTEAKDAPLPVPQIREARDAVLDDIRVYAAQIVGSVTRKNPASEDVAEALLRPIAAWPVRRAGSAVAADGAPSPVTTAPAE